MMICDKKVNKPREAHFLVCVAKAGSERGSCVRIAIVYSGVFLLIYSGGVSYINYVSFGFFSYLSQMCTKLCLMLVRFNK